MGGCALAPLPSSGSVSLPQKPISASAQSSSTDRDFLTDEERKVVLETWALLSSAGGATQETGVRILLRFFELAPDAKMAFPTFRDLDDDELPRNLLFRSHALRFMRAVEAVTMNIDLLELTVIPNLLSLGRRHASIDGFKVMYLRVVEKAMIDVWNEVLGGKFDRTARDAWSKVFHFIAEHLYLGIQEQKQQQQQRIEDNKSNPVI